MEERDHLVIGLVKHLLGPQDGQFEVLPETRDPRSEYITGVLAPELNEREQDDPTAEIDEAIEEVTDDENQSAEGIIIAPPSAFSPALDPKSQPRSIGLTFVVVADEQVPTIEICATWARYLPHEIGGWRRTPEVFISPAVQVTGNKRWHARSDVDLYLRTRPQPNGSYRVSLYLVNQRSIATGQRATTPDYVFQPQIRVHCAPGTDLVSITPSANTIADPLTDDDTQLAMLYRDRVALARGHMCGAVWKDVDPERPHPTLSSPQEAPFAWTDRSLLSPGVQRKFSPADVRTEFLPCYPIEAPEMNWPASAGPEPEMDPLILAQTWSPDEIRNRLEPLVHGYEQWIAGQRSQVQLLAQHWQPVATRNLAKCEQAALRMQEGIEWLVRDEDARLAFCFANRAIALQSTWVGDKRVRPWRVFQLAFILLNIPALADPEHADRAICDLLWIPTGGGKTEAYLGLTAFTLALRRRRALRQDNSERTGGGVSVLSRYTLRLLTIQQFRRALGVITACEMLRVMHLGTADLPVGWRPSSYKSREDFLWGGMRFSVGMWVGGGVTPNSLLAFDYRKPSGQIQHVAGALEILQGVSNRGYDGPDQALRRSLQNKQVTAEGDPAQVLTCPVCQTWLAVPEEGLGAGQHTIHFVFTGQVRTAPLSPSIFNTSRIQTAATRLTHQAAETHTISITFTVPVGQHIYGRDIDRWWHEVISTRLNVSGTTGCQLQAARPSRPGYFLCVFENRRANAKPNTFEIYCPNPECTLNQSAWAEQVPLNVASNGSQAGQNQLNFQDNLLPNLPGGCWQNIPGPFQWNNHRQIGDRIPIPAHTTDDQVYHRCPSLVIATVDKFARLAFEPKASSMFGYVTHYHSRWGYYREGCPPDWGTLPETPSPHPPGYSTNQPLNTPVDRFLPPDLIIQDELHLIEGPLGSMVGLYETAIDLLCTCETGQGKIRPKYIASTATVRQAESQVQSLFDRDLAQFPPSALSVDDRFFARTSETHPLESSRAGRLYIAVAAPGKGALTPIVRMWAALLQTVHQRRQAGAGPELDGFWTLVGYFNALRELAGAAALYRQDIRERINTYAAANARPLNDHALELSSRASSLALPGLLDQLAQPWGEDAVLATSMFGTGVDVDRLGLMVVHGQPKTTSSYIQATGRVGRKQGGLIVTFFRTSRPRDLDHYEFFTGYHRMLYRAVEPITVTPFAPRARERGIGPLAVVLLRQAASLGGHPIQHPWHVQQRIQGGYFSQAMLMGRHRRDAAVEALPGIFEERARQQPDGRCPEPGAVENEVASELDRWANIVYDQLQRNGQIHDELVYNESTMLREPERAVILGDPQHQLNRLPVAFENAPTSLRDVEVTTFFKG
jgi:hypothetical protein